MIRVESSLKILMEGTPSQPYRPDKKREMAPIIPLTSTESLVAARGLGRHIDIIYRGVNRSAKDPDKALEVVFDFLSTAPDAFRQRAQNALTTLNSEDESFALHAAVITPTRMGYVARKTGEWLVGARKEERMLELFKETMRFNEDQQQAGRRWASISASNSRYFWLEQLENTRHHPLVMEIAEKIDNAQPTDSFIEDSSEV